MSSNSEGNESGWDIVVGVLLVQVVMSLVASEYPSRSTPAAGSPMTGLSAVFFLFWGIVFLVAPHYQQRSVLFRFLNARNDSPFVGGGFLLVSVWLFATWAG